MGVRCCTTVGKCFEPASSELQDATRHIVNQALESHFTKWYISLQKNPWRFFLHCLNLQAKYHKCDMERKSICKKWSFACP